jgi:hypothetical protein
MFIQRLAIVSLLAVCLSTMLAGPASAKRPTAPPPPTVAGERPLTAQELAESDARIAAAHGYVEEARRQGLDLVSLGCVTPNAVGSGPLPNACSVPQGFLSVEARDQIKSHYCGPATGQVISNYTWATGAGANKYAQAVIAGWMKTDVNGFTNAPELEDGLEAATVRAPRRPAAWNWVVSPLEDEDNDGTVGDDLHAMVRSNVSGAKMPLALAVKPYDPNGTYHLSSWDEPVTSPGHWIAVYGWVGLYTGTDSSRLYYTDSSRDEGGATGRFWDPLRHIAIMIMAHTQRLVW